MTQFSRQIALSVNGEIRHAEVEPRTHLADFLRENEFLTGTHLGCEQGVCGACTIFVDGHPVRSCLTLAVACDGTEVKTIEGFDDDPLMAQIRKSFSTKHGLQCGYCTPGMLTTAYDIIRRLPDANNDRIRRELSGNLCRCTGYQGVVSAIRDVLENDPAAAEVTPGNRGNVRRTFGFNTTIASKATDTSPPQTLEIKTFDISDGVLLKRSMIVNAPTDAVWSIISNLPSVASCIPGAVLNKIPNAGNTFSGKFVVSLGPIKAAFSGNGLLELNNNALTGCVTGHGNDRISRSNVTGSLSFKLERENAASCRLHLDMTYDLRGPLAQFGRKALVEEIADQLLIDTTDNIAARAAGQDAATSSPREIAGFSFMLSVIRGLFRRVFR